MRARRLFVLWRRARRSGRDLDLVGYAVGVIGGTLFLAAMTGVLGPTLDDTQHIRAGAERHATR